MKPDPPDSATKRPKLVRLEVRAQMSSPIPRTSESDSRDAESQLGHKPHDRGFCAQRPPQGPKKLLPDLSCRPGGRPRRLDAQATRMTCWPTWCRRPRSRRDREPSAEDKDRPAWLALAAMQPARGSFRGLQGEDDVACATAETSSIGQPWWWPSTMRGSVGHDASGRRWKCVRYGLSCRFSRPSGWADCSHSHVGLCTRSILGKVAQVDRSRRSHSRTSVWRRSSRHH